MIAVLKRLKWWLLLTVLACLTAPLVAAWPEYSRLARYGSFIQARYAAEIAAIDVVAHKAKAKSPDDDHDARMMIRENLEHTFDASVFYCVLATRDGHHGSMTIKTYAESGPLSRSGWVCAWVGNHSTIRAGKSPSGKPLLAYTKWVPDAPDYRHFLLEFSQDMLEEEMATNAVR